MAEAFKIATSFATAVAKTGADVAISGLKTTADMGMQAATGVVTATKTMAEAGAEFANRPEVKAAAVNGLNVVADVVKGTADITLNGLKATTEIGMDAAAGVETAVKYVAETGVEFANKPEVKSAAITALKVTAGAAVAVATANVALPAAGFTASGVGAGTLASTVQSSIGNVAAGSIFAQLQSAGAAGMATSTQAVIGAIGGFGTYIGKKIWRDETE